MRLNLFFRLINLILRKRPVWVVYEMWDAPGRVCILGAYLDHDQASDQLDILRGRNPLKRYGLQMTQMERRK